MFLAFTVKREQELEPNLFVKNNRELKICHVRTKKFRIKQKTTVRQLPIRMAKSDLAGSFFQFYKLNRINGGAAVERSRTNRACF